MVGQVQGIPCAQKTCQLPACPVGEPVFKLLSVRWRLCSIRITLADWEQHLQSSTDGDVHPDSHRRLCPELAVAFRLQ